MSEELNEAKRLLQQALGILADLNQVKAEHSAAKKPLSQIDYVPVVAKVLARKPGAEMYYRDIAKIIQDERLISFEPVDIELVSLNTREQVPRMVIRVRDALSDTKLGAQFFERGSKKGYYKLSEQGALFY